VSIRPQTGDLRISKPTGPSLRGCTQSWAC